MKYFPLIWAALWRKPARTVLTFLAAVAAFTLFGLAIGVNATYAELFGRARAERVFVNPRFEGKLTLAQRDRIAKMEGVREIGVEDFFVGYYREPKNRVVPLFVDRNIRRAWPEIPLTSSQWDQLEANATGVFLDKNTAARLGIKAGDTMPVLTSTPSRRDGSKLWVFSVLGVMENPPFARGGLVLANYDYFNRTRPLLDVGKVGQLNVLLKDPDRTAAFAGQVEQMFANSANPTWGIPDKVLAQVASRYQFNIPLVTQGVSAAGLFMILFLIANGISQSVRERMAEFAVLKTLGFSDWKVMALVFVEAAIPCLLGAIAGYCIALVVSSQIAQLSVLQKLYVAPPTLSLGVLTIGIACAVLVALTSAALPAWRIRCLAIASALRR